MLTDDIVGNTQGGNGDQATTAGSASSPRASPSTETEAQARTRRSVGGENDGPSRQLARYIKEVAELYLTDFEVTLVFRRDRYGRGGDHIPFNERGYAAVRFTEPNEDFDRQHQKVEVGTASPFGDVVERVDFAYVAQVARVNAAALASLALAPAPPTDVRFGTGRQEYDTRIAWKRGSEPDLAGYRVVWRPTHQPFWTRGLDVGDKPPTRSRRSSKGSPRTTCSSPSRPSTATATPACRPSPSRPRSDRPRPIASDAGGLRDWIGCCPLPSPVAKGYHSMTDVVGLVTFNQEPHRWARARVGGHDRRNHGGDRGGRDGAGRDELPRYRLEPGMELSYKGSSTFRHQNGMHIDESGDDRVGRSPQRRRQRPRGAATGQPVHGDLDCAESTSRACSRSSPSRRWSTTSATSTCSPTADSGPTPSWATASIRPPCSRACPTTRRRRRPDGASETTGWGRSTATRALRAEQGGWSFHSERVGAENKIYGMTADSTFHFDAARGAIRRIEQEYTQDYGFKGKGSGSIELTGVETHDAAWLAAFAPAAERYFAASKAYERATEEASKAADKAETLLADAKAALESARDAIDHPIFREQLDRQIAQHDGMVKLLRRFGEAPGRRGGQARGRLGVAGARRQDARAGRLSRQGGGARLLVSGLRLVHQGDAAAQRLGRAVRGTSGGRAGHEHRSQRGRREVRDARRWA